MESRIEDHLLAMLNKQKKDSLSISQIRTRMSTSVLKHFGLSRASQPADILRAFSPFLGRKLRAYKSSRSVHIGLNLPLEEMILNKLRQRGNISLKQLGKYLPVSEKEYIHGINHLIETGAVRCSVNEKYAVFVKSASDANLPMQDRDAFEAAYHKIGKGRGFVRIHQIREDLRWDKERFDRVLKMLMADYTIELHGGDPTVLNKRQIRNSFTDERGVLYITLTWWGKRS
jgi:hypothetical protein